MKKYLMSGLAVLAMAFVAASCSSDDVYDASRSKVQDQYDAAFIKTFGNPASNQDWGFGTLYTNSTRSLNFTRVVKHDINFPDAPESYPTNYDGATQFAGGWKVIAGDALYIADESINNVDLQGYGSLYLAKSESGDGNYTPSTYWYVGNVTAGQKLKVYLLPGVTLNLSANQPNFQQNVEFYVCPNAAIVCEDVLRLNSATLYVAAGANVSAKKLETNGTGIFYNQGTTDVDGELSVENASCFIVNEGTLNADSYGSHGSGNFLNVSGGIVTIDDVTEVNSNSNAWVNEGEYTTKYFNYTAGSTNVWNNCKLTVTEDFNVNLGDSPTSCFYLDGGASVVTKNFNGGGNFEAYYPAWYQNVKFQGGPFKIIMGQNSLFKVTGTATMHATEPVYGIYGPSTGEFAVFQANTIVAGGTNQGFEVTYGGNLAVSAESHFANGNDGNPTHPYIDIKDNAQIYAPGFTSGKPAITIPSSPCNPGFNGGGNIPVNYDVRIIAEDLSATESSDFDFNDVVFDVHFTSNTAATITLRAAGGTLPLRIMRNDDWEVHKLFGYGNNTSVMINTDATARGYQTDPEADHKEPVVFTIESGLDRDTNKGNDIIIEVEKDGVWYEITAVKGKPAAKLAVAPQFPWVMEKVPMTSVYNRFSGWVQNPDVRWY